MDQNPAALFTNFVIRPMRNAYPPDSNQTININNKSYKSEVLQLKNTSNQMLSCTFIQPIDQERPSKLMPCVIYMHGNAGNKLEGFFSYSEPLLQAGINLFVFDFSGCGNSQGDWVTLGWKEQNDLRCIVNYLRQTNSVSKIAFWGRSMGAATTLLYQGSLKETELQQLGASCLVLDSSFSKLENLLLQIGKQFLQMPDEILMMFIQPLKEQIFNTTGGMNIDEIKPIEGAKKCKIPAFFLHAEGDTLIPFDNCSEIVEVYGNQDDYLIEICKGDHNTERSKEIVQSIIKFLLKHLKE